MQIRKVSLFSFPLVIISIVFSLTRMSNQVSLEEDLTISKSQKEVLDQFREFMNPILTHPYMKRDIYLIRWLRARDFNMIESAILLAQNLQWRKEQKIDTILDEDWSDLESRFPYYIEGCDKEGRPVASVSVGEWDVRSVIIAGKRDRMIRYFDKLIEQVNFLVRRSQDKGENLTQYSIIFDMANYNLVEQGCAQCIPVYLSMFVSYETHFTGNVHKMYLLNTPPIFQALLSIIRPLLSPLTRDALLIYGTNKMEWQKVLLEDMDSSQLSKAFGGEKEEGFEPQEVNKWKDVKCYTEAIDIQNNKSSRNNSTNQPQQEIN